ncbi:MAG TPA: TIGR03067 domain-containing protein [Gemmataceae bacterium]|nr:TIGR03067 domain-containing protein [Gemmataceae bacterium]
MRRFLAVVALAFGLTAAADEKDVKDPKAELELFTGTWQAVSYVRDGKELPVAEAEKVRLVVAGEKYTLTDGGEAIEGTHKVDPTKKPKEIDAVRTKGPHKGEALKGVYQLSADSFLVSFSAPGKDRPATLDSKGGPGLRVIGFKRVKK